MPGDNGKGADKDVVIIGGGAAGVAAPGACKRSARIFPSSCWKPATVSAAGPGRSGCREHRMSRSISAAAGCMGRGPMPGRRLPRRSD